MMELATATITTRGLTTALDKPTSQWTVSTQSTLNPAQNYWSDIDFDVKTTGTITFLEDLYVG